MKFFGKKVSDETACGIFLMIWELFFLIAALSESAVGWTLFIADTITQLVWLYFSEKNERLARLERKQSERFKQIASDYLRYVRNVDRTEGANHYDQYSQAECKRQKIH